MNTYFSQHGDDLVIANIFEIAELPMRTGPRLFSWLDLGAHHPYELSNTKILSDKGYFGVNVEANPYLIQRFVDERPNDLTLNIGVFTEQGTKNFYMYDQFSGRNTFCHKETETYGALVTQQLLIPVVRLNDIVTFNCDNVFPPLLNIDIEGLDYPVLETADFSQSRPFVIVVETRREDTKKMAEMLFKKGFTLHSRMGENLIFIIQSHAHKAY